MILRPGRIFRNRICRFFGIAFVLIATWFAWWFWPPQPGVRIVIPTSWSFAKGAVTADGRSLICAPDWRATFLTDDRSPPAKVFGLPAGDYRLTLTDDIDSISISPDGSRLFGRSKNGNRQLLALPNGESILTLPPVGRNHDSTAYWTSDGRHFFLFDDQVCAYRSDSGECVGKFDVSDVIFALNSNGSGFVSLANERWELLLHSFDTNSPDTSIPLPGPPAYDRHDPDQRPANGSVLIETLTLSNDGNCVFVFLHRHEQDGDHDRRRRYLARWDRKTKKWSEMDLGPVAESWMLVFSAIVDAKGRYLARRTLDAFERKPPANADESDVRNDATRFLKCDLWDAASIPPRCLNDEGFPNGSPYFDPTGRRIVLINWTEGRTISLFDAETLVQLNSHAFTQEAEPLFSPNGNWAAFCDQPESSKSSLLPAQLVEWLEKLVSRPKVISTIDIMRLTDGKMVRHLVNRSSPTLTADGYLWTVTETGQSGDTTTLVAERWSPETPGPPWWLMLLTAVLCISLVWDLRRAWRVTSS